MCYVSYFSRRYHLNEISYSILTKNKQKHMKLWFWIEELHVICLKEVSFEWNFILISAKNKHKIEKIYILNRGVMCHISQGGIIWMKFHTQCQLTISKNTWMILNWRVTRHMSQGRYEWNFILISAKNKHKIEKIWFGIEVLCVLFYKRVFL